MTVGSTALMLWVISFCKIPTAVILAFWMLSGVFVFLFAPVQNRNKRLDEVERVVYRKKALVILMLESIFLWGLYVLKFSEITDAIAVRFYGSYISASSPIFASAGSKSFTFSGGYGVNQNVTFKIMDDGANTGSASGSAYKNTY